MKSYLVGTSSTGRKYLSSKWVPLIFKELALDCAIVDLSTQQPLKFVLLSRKETLNIGDSVNEMKQYLVYSCEIFLPRESLQASADI